VRLLWVLLGVLLLLAVGVSVQDLLRSGSSGGDRVAPAASDEVVRVVDGDTVVLRSAGKSRLIGVDSPEVFGERECFGRDASAFAKRLLRPGLRVEVERDVEEHDRYGRRLIYLRLPDGRSFNELLVAEGFAVPLRVPPTCGMPSGSANSPAERASAKPGCGHRARAGASRVDERVGRGR
jgi:micrococcal nuclease